MKQLVQPIVETCHIDDLTNDLHKLLLDEVDQLLPAAVSTSGNAVARQARSRLLATAEHSPAFIIMLAEPWLVSPASVNTRRILENCARIHLYARILDDALDENLPVHRQNLLRAQPMLWCAIHALSQHAPELGRESAALIAETIEAVRCDDINPDPDFWGAKNHHLLLAPMLLSRNGADYLTCRTGLSALISLVQAGDEWRQDVLKSSKISDALLEKIPALIDTEQLARLQSHGWVTAADRILLEGRKILHAIQSRRYS